MNIWKIHWSMVLIDSPRLWLSLTLYLFILSPAFCAAASPSAPARLHLPEARLTPPEVHPGVYAKIYSPKTAGPAPGVVLLHGRGGIFPVYHQLAQALAAQGYMALVVVAYYGRAPVSLGQYASTFPPALILHGDADSWIPVQHAYAIHDTLTKHGRTVAMHIYPGLVHGFDVHWQGHDPHATADARQRTLTFLAQHLRPMETTPAPGVGASAPAEPLSTVTYTEMTMWTHAGSGAEGLTLQPGVSVWERSAGQWRLVSIKHGSPYRAYTQSRSR
jgi:acetyl esterase/lipase